MFSNQIIGVCDFKISLHLMTTYKDLNTYYKLVINIWTEKTK